jgi:hypothetical protein
MAAIPVSAAHGQEAVTPQFLTNTFMEVCQTALDDFENAVRSLLGAGWQSPARTQKNDKFQSLDLLSPDRSVRAHLQRFDFGPGTFEQCSVEGYAKFSEADIAETLKRFPSATGRMVTNKNGSHSGLWLLTDQPTFTSLNILYNEHAASMITMRTTYSGPSGVQQ